MSDMCLACHEPVAAEIAAKKGAHGPLAGGQSSPTCRGCHPEHHGATGALTSFNEATFPHGLTGFSLQGHEDGQGSEVHLRRLPPQGLRGVRPGHLRRLSRGHERSVHDQARGHLRQGLPGMPRRHRQHQRRPQQVRLQADWKARRSGLRRLPQGRAVPAGLPADASGLLLLPRQGRPTQGPFGKDCGGCHTAAGWGDATFDHTIFPVDHGRDQQQPTCQTCHPVAPTSTRASGVTHTRRPTSRAGTRAGASPS